ADHGQRYGFQDQRATYRSAVGRDPVGLADDDPGNEIGEEVALARPRIGSGTDLLGAERTRQRPDQLVDGRALLRTRGEVEPAQVRIHVVARRLEDLVEEIVDLWLEPRHLRREAEQLHAVLRRRLVLQAVECLLAQAFQQTVELDRYLSDQI